MEKSLVEIQQQQKIHEDFIKLANKHKLVFKKIRFWSNCVRIELWTELPNER